jgi:hypothetical protein
MYIINNNTNPITIFHKTLQPGETRMFNFASTVVDVVISIGDHIVYTSKLPSEITLEIDDHKINIDNKTMLFEYFRPSSHINIYTLIFLLCVTALVLFLVRKYAAYIG